MAEARNYLEHKYEKALVTLNTGANEEQKKLLDEYIDKQNQQKQIDEALKQSSQIELQEKEARTLQELEGITKTYEDEQRKLQQEKDEEERKRLKEEQERLANEQDENLKNDALINAEQQIEYIKIYTDQFEANLGIYKKDFETNKTEIEKMKNELNNDEDTILSDSRPEVTLVLNILNGGVNCEYIGKMILPEKILVQHLQKENQLLRKTS